MKVEVHPTRNLELNSLCPFEMKILRQLENQFGQLKIEPQKEKSADSISKTFTALALKSNWTQQFRFDPDIPLQRAYANYLMDAVSDEYDSDCGHSHRVSIQSCFDNRQAIGTNLLKFEVAATKFLRSDDYRILSVIICANREAKKILKLDNSVATFEEYLVGVRTAYKGILTAPLLLIEIAP